MITKTNPVCYTMLAVKEIIIGLTGEKLTPDREKRFKSCIAKCYRLFGEAIPHEKVDGKLCMFPHHVQMILEHMNVLKISKSRDYVRSKGIRLTRGQRISLGIQATTIAKSKNFYITRENGISVLPVKFWDDALERIIPLMEDEAIDELSSYTLDDMYGSAS